MSRAENMERHLIAQFAGKPIMDAMLEAFGSEMDEITTAYQNLRSKRWINTGEGSQLDGIGAIVCQPRQINDAVQIAFFGFTDQPNAHGFEQDRFRDSWETWLESVNLSDAEYRLLLWQKVAKNTSICTAEDTINSLVFIFSTHHVVLEEIGNAKITIAIGKMLTRNDITIANAVDLFIRAGGIGVERQIYFDYDSYFGFIGQPNARGFEAGIMADIF